MSPFKPLSILLLSALGVTLAACGSSSGNSASGSSSPAATSAASSAAAPSAGAPSSAPAGSAAAIKTNWTAFFSSKTPVPKRVTLLQDGQQFASIIKSEAGSGLASEASVKVTKVVVRSASQATVTYSILVDGQPALAGKKGTAVLQDGTWKVGVASFCGLISLEDTGGTAKLPPACGSAG